MTQENYKHLAYAYETRMPEVAGNERSEDSGRNNGRVTATPSGADTINIDWTAVSGALGYNIYRSTAADRVFTKMNSAPITGASYSRFRATNLPTSSPMSEAPAEKISERTFVPVRFISETLGVNNFSKASYPTYLLKLHVKIRYYKIKLPHMESTCGQPSFYTFLC